MSVITCLMGPTAAGKSRIALELATQFPFEIISVDSAMVYRHMDIGTAKPTQQELASVPHHLIDIRDPGDPYSVAQFQEDTQRLIQEILAREKLPLLVGGTMLYLKALQNGLSPLPSADVNVRNRLLAEANLYGWDYLYTKLQKVDPASAHRIKPTDPQRIQRALEVFEITGQTLSHWWEHHPKEKPTYHTINLIVATADREHLHRKISQRFHTMLEQGFVAEVSNLYQRDDLHLDLPAIRSVGYRQIWMHLKGELTYPEMVERGIIATRQLAKRQLTWLRSWQNVAWFDSQNNGVTDKIITYLKTNIFP